MGTQALFLCRLGLVCSSQSCMLWQKVPGSLLESRSEVRFLLCTYVWRSLCTTFWEIFDSRRKAIYGLSVWIHLFRRSGAFPWHLNALQLYKSFPCISFCFWDHLSMYSEASRISWHGFYQLILYYSAKLSSGTPPCLISLCIHTWSKKEIHCPSQLLTADILFKKLPYFWKRSRFSDDKLHISNTWILI